MKVTGPASPTTSAPALRTPSAPAGFSLSGAGGAPAAGATGSAPSVAGVANVSALMALQGVEDVTERRRRAIRRGHGLLDRLEELKLTLLSGDTGEGVLDRLARAAREAREDGAEPELAVVLDQIDLRAAVELAKAEVRRDAA